MNPTDPFAFISAFKKQLDWKKNKPIVCDDEFAFDPLFDLLKENDPKIMPDLLKRHLELMENFP